MKKAKRADFYRRAFENESSFQVSSFRLTHGITVGTLDINFAGRITALCGANGAGKTTLLQAITGLLNAVDGEKIERGARKLNGASASVTFTLGGVEGTIQCEFQSGVYQNRQGPADISAIYLDPATRAKQISDLVETQENFDEVIEGLEPSVLDAKKLDLFSYVLRRTYTKIEIYEIEEFSALGPFPYFVVESSGTRYDSSTLGLGELTAMLVLWELYRLPSDVTTVLLLEEPETHVSARSQSALIDTVVMFSTIRKINVVVSTHSANIVECIPNDHIKYLVRTGDSVEVVDNPTDLQLEEMLGKTPRFRGVALVEDALAQGYLKAILRRLDPELLRIFDVVIAGDSSKITSVLTNLPLLGWLKIDGVYDGDLYKDATANKTLVESKHNGRFLPFQSAIESVFMHLAKVRVADLAQGLHIGEAECAMLLASLEGDNPHDWFKDLCRAADLTEPQLISIFLEMQLADADARAELEHFVRGLRDAATSEEKSKFDA